MMATNALIHRMRSKLNIFLQLHCVLSGFWNNLAAHLARSPLNHSYCYASAGDRATCFARLPQKPDPGETCGLTIIKWSHEPVAGTG